MKYAVQRACGHTEIKTIFGSGKDREITLARMRNDLCEECLLKQNLLILDSDMRDGMCDLAGTQKQRPYAAAVRHYKWESVKRWAGEEEARLQTSFANGDITYSAFQSFLKTSQEKMKAAENNLAVIESASWWIERRNFSPKSMFIEISSVK